MGRTCGACRYRTIGLDRNADGRSIGSGWTSAAFPDVLQRQHADQHRKQEERDQHDNHEERHCETPFSGRPILVVVQAGDQ